MQMTMTNGVRRKSKLEVILHPGASSYTFKEEIVSEAGFGWHFHSEVEINFVRKGRGLRFVGDSIEPFQDGDLVILGPNLPHACPKPALGESLHTVVVQFPINLLDAPMQALPDLRPIARLLERSRQGLKVQGMARLKAVEAMEEMARMSPGSSRRASKLIYLLSLLAESGDCRTLVRGLVRLPEVNPGDKRLQLVFKLINEDLPEVPTEKAISKKLGLTPGAFSHFFRRAMGKTYLDFAGELRVGLACRALLETENSIAKVAFESGFSNLSNFHRQFKKQKGLTPLAFRRLALKEATMAPA